MDIKFESTDFYKIIMKAHGIESSDFVTYLFSFLDYFLKITMAQDHAILIRRNLFILLLFHQIHDQLTKLEW